MGEPREEAMTDLATKPVSEPPVSELEVDQDLLEEAQRQISAASPNAAINEALRRLVEEERAKRRAGLEKLRQMHDEGAFDYSQLDAADQ
jgi:Arc/MetJ family transcription regulator